MAINYARLFHRRAIPQSEPIPGSAQVPNSAGGYVWQADDWTRLDRFLILGAEGGTYYIGERNLVKQNHDALVRCIQADGVRAVNRIVEISDSGRAPKHDPAIFALALVAAHGNPAAKALAFQKLGKPVLLALDVSGSMDGSQIAGSCLTAREASAAMALVTAATEPGCEIIAFSAPAGGGYGGMHGGGESGITRVALSARMRLDDVIKRVRAIPMGGTDCALPMIWGRRQKLTVSGFITYTDSETWAGDLHPAQALRLYRDEFVSDAKAVVVGMTSNGFTLADPNDRGMLDVVGFDATVPAVIADYSRAA